MNLTSPKTIKNLLKSYQISPSKGLGQNFLTDRGAIRKIIEAAELSPEDTILEIGPGLGVLTQELAKRTKRVIAVEKDPGMVKILEKTLKDYKNIEVINEDIRRSDLLILHKFREVGPLNFKVIGNLPFYLTAPVIRQFLELHEVRPHTMTLVVQKEVAQRICPTCRQAGAKPKMNLLAVSVQFYAKPKIISYVSKDSFWPSPEVNAAIIKITPLVSRTVLDTSLFFKIVKAGFSQPRKQLANNLSKKLGVDKKRIGEWLLKNGVSPTQRAETLNLQTWINMTKSFISI